MPFNNSTVVTPVSYKTLEILLEGYPPKKGLLLVEGFKNGFRLGYEGPRETRLSNNLISASQYPDIVDKKIKKEVSLGRIVGPFSNLPFKNLQVSPIGVVPKKEAGQYRLIHHLSYPQNCSINDFIPDESKRVSYATIDNAIDLIVALGPNCKLAKTDIDSAYRNVPIHPNDHELLGISWAGQYYFDRCLPMGCASSCAIFEDFSIALQWIAQNKFNIKHMVHILDDFLFLGPAQSEICEQSLSLFLKLCHTLGVPIKEEKTEHACTCLTFLGIELDTILREARLPSEKILKITSTLASMKNRKKIMLRDLQSVIGLLNFACCVVLPGRAFLRRLIDLTKGITKQHHYIRLTKESRADLEMWYFFIKNFNGKILFLNQIWQSSEKLHLYTDAAGSIGYGAVYNTHWFYGMWLYALKDCNITFKELYPIVLAVETWGNMFKNSCIIFHSDNQAVVYIINKQTCKDPVVMKLVRRLILACLQRNILMRAEHIAGTCNVLPDFLSRFQIQEFRRQAPHMDLEPTIVPQSLLDV